MKDLSQARVSRRTLGKAFGAVLLGVGGAGAWLETRPSSSAAAASVTASATSAATASQNTATALSSEALSGADTGRVNILLAGNSVDDAGHGGAALTDSIMIASLNETNHEVSLVSIPRDLLVSYGGTPMKINAVYPSAASGDQGASTNGDQASGMAALAGVVTTVTGLPIHHHALVSYMAVQKIVDAVGGITVTIAASDARGIYDPASGLRIANGTQTIDGATALKLCRARNDPVSGTTPYGIPNSDFTRAEHQRMVLTAIATKLRTTPTLANPVTDVALYRSLSSTMWTDISAAQIVSLSSFATASTGTPVSLSIKGGSDAASLLTDGSAGDIVDALVPKAGTYDYAVIKSYVATHLG